MTPPEHVAAWEDVAPEREPEGFAWLPGPLVGKLLAVAALAIVLSAMLTVWVLSRAAGQEVMQRLVSQQNDEVELVARLLASKIEQSQKVLATVAEGITPELLESPASLEWLLQQGLPAVRFFDAIQVARKDGNLAINLRYGKLEKASGLDPGERDYLVRTLLDGKPLVSGLIGATPAEARVMFTMPLLRGEGRVIGAVAGVLRLQSQGLLPHSLALPARSDSQLVVFTRDGVILAHPSMERVLGQVADEPGLGEAYARWRRADDAPLAGRAQTTVQADHVVSLASVPMPQWVVARVSASQAVLAPMQGVQRRAWALAAAATALVALLALGAMLWIARPLILLRQRARALMDAEAAGAPAGGSAGHDGPWPHSPGEVDDVVRVCTRLLEHRRLQQRGSEASARQLRAVLAHVPLGIVVSRDEQVEVVSQQAGRMLGYAPAQLQGRRLTDLLASPPGAVDVAQQVRARFAAHGSFDGELPLLRKDGSTLWVRAQGQLVEPGVPASGLVWTLEDFTAERAARQQQSWERAHDPLTQLLNRAEFELRLQMLLDARAARGPRGVPEEDGGVLLFMDLDHFTVVNDVAGHDAGDDVLRHLARLLESEVRHNGWAARVGGDEFAIVLPGSSLARGQAVAEQLRAAVQAWEPAYGGRSFTLGLSVGLVPLAPGAHGVAALLYAADMACYQAKRAGRNRIAVGSVQVPA